MNHFTRIADLGPKGVEKILEQAAFAKFRDRTGRPFLNKILGMVFFNPSLRTRASFEAAMIRGGGAAIVLDVGQGTWKLETRDGVAMDGDRPEHIREAIPVLARYADALAVRTFADLKNDDEDEQDTIINAFRALSTVPVITMESAREHPCQGLADMLTAREKFGHTAGLPVTLTWAPHIKPLPKAVPHSFLLTAAAAGAQVTVAHPPGFELHPAVRAEAEAYAQATGGTVRYTHDQREAVAGAKVVYAKAWGPATPLLGTPAAEAAVRAHPEWMVNRALMNAADSGAIFMHCLPTRRDVEVAAEVLDHPSSKVVDEAENRYWVQRALLRWLWEG